MNRKIHDILKKINYIEADIEIQKQILFSIPAGDKGEMERILTVIAAQKEEITALRQIIQEMSPAEHKRIMLLEESVAAFKKTAGERKFKSVEGRKINEECSLSLKDTSRIPCLVKACDEEGGWTIITMEGEIKHFSRHEVDGTCP